MKREMMVLCAAFIGFYAIPSLGQASYGDTVIETTKGVETTEIRDLPGLVSLFEFYDSEGNMISIAGKPRK